MCTLVVAGIVLAIGVPAFTTFVLDARRTADVNGFVLAVQLARNEAAKRGAAVVVCPSADGARCAPGMRYDDGWIVFVNVDDVRPPQRSSTEPLLYVYRPEATGSIVGNRELFEFQPFHFKRSTNGTVVFCDQRGSASARAVIVSYTGRPRPDSVDADGRPLKCAGFP
jgi:type IV fimbrial biogenesis protein FimT